MGSEWQQLWDKMMSLYFMLDSFCKWLFCIQMYAGLESQKKMAVTFEYTKGLLTSS